MKTINKIPFALLLMVLLYLASCEDLLTPSPDNRMPEDRLFRDAAFAEGILLNGYKNISNSYNFTEIATDDAVSNNFGSNLWRVARGEWSSRFNPLSSWDYAYESIFYMNYFLNIVDRVTWSHRSSERNELFRQRFKGEAHALRAWYYLDLLQKHGGVGENGELLGVVIQDTYEPADVSINKPRSSYEDCVEFILEDCDTALSLLPLEYGTIGDPAYDVVFSPVNKIRVNGLFVKALKSRLLIHAASPSFNLNDDSDKWIEAATAAADLLNEIGGISGLSPTGRAWYLDENDPEIIYRRNTNSILEWEEQNFPPSLFGNGEVNPSQNLVDAFPMANGYPITDVTSGYDPDAPYTDRDPRLTEDIVYDGNTMSEDTINTDVTSPQNGINMTPQSTRSGYYLKKLMNEGVRLTPGSTLSRIHFYTIFRYTEIFLNYAEAANEAWGPDADPESTGMTARGIIAAIRNRGGIAQPDNYLSSLTTKEEMRDIIRNERRIELSYEGFRFWDLRRWGLNLSETVEGMQISQGTYEIIDVENRPFNSYMKYGPVPYNETLVNDILVQNQGW